MADRHATRFAASVDHDAQVARHPVLIVYPPDLGEVRALSEGDLEMLRGWRNAPEVRLRMYTQHEISPEEHRRWWEAKSRSERDRLLIFSQGGRPCGFFAFSEIHPDWRTASWAFYAAPDAPKGTGSRMEMRALDMAFGELGLRKLCCEVLSSNPGVLALHLKHGFVQEGLLRHHVRTPEGFDNIHQLAIFAQDWAATRPVMLQRLSSFPA